MRLSAADLSYSRRLTDPLGAPLRGLVEITINLYTSATSALPSHSILKSAVPLADGIFQVTLELPEPKLQELLGDGEQSLYVEVVSGGKSYPRQLFHAVPFALMVPVETLKLVYDSQGRLTFSSTALNGLGGSGSNPLASLSSLGMLERINGDTYVTYAVTAAGKALVGATDAAAQRTILGLGSMAFRDALALADLPVSPCATGLVRKIVGGVGKMLRHAEYDSLLQTELKNLCSLAP